MGDTEELELLRDLHWKVRRLFRYNGVDAKRANEAYAEVSEAMHKVNDFNDRMDDDG